MTEIIRASVVITLPVEEIAQHPWLSLRSAAFRQQDMAIDLGMAPERVNLEYKAHRLDPFYPVVEAYFAVVFDV